MVMTCSLIWPRSFCDALLSWVRFTCTLRGDCLHTGHSVIANFPSNTPKLGHNSSHDEGREALRREAGSLDIVKQKFQGLSDDDLG